jgi:hypothetical protein
MKALYIGFATHYISLMTLVKELISVERSGGNGESPAVSYGEASKR